MPTGQMLSGARGVGRAVHDQCRRHVTSGNEIGSDFFDSDRRDVISAAISPTRHRPVVAEQAQRQRAPARESIGVHIGAAPGGHHASQLEIRTRYRQRHAIHDRLCAWSPQAAPTWHPSENRGAG